MSIQVDDLIEKSGQLSQQLGTAKAENVSLQNRVQQLNKEAAAVEERVKEGKTKFEAKVTDINRLERELATERGTVQTQKNHAEETTKRITDLDVDLRSVERAISWVELPFTRIVRI